MKFPIQQLLLLALFPTLSCAQPGVEYKPTIRLGGIVADSVEADLDVLGYSVSGDSEYSSVEIGIGSTAYKEGVRKSSAELVIAKSSYGDVDALEISGGGRIYFGSSESLSPYFGVYTVSTIFDDVDYIDPYWGLTSVSPGVQLGVRVGLGAEYRLNDQFFVDTSLRYLVPLLAAESDTYPSVETEVSGMSLEVGLGFEF